MKALRIGDGGALAVVDVPRPKPKPKEALVRITTAGLNRADVSQRRGKYPAPPDVPADIPGLEFAGVIEEAASTRLRPGQRVLGLTGGGAQAEYIAIPEDLLLAAPEGISDIEAGAIPEAYITAHDALCTQAALHRGERVLVHAVASGVGLAALQIAKALGCIIFGTSRSPEKLERVRSMGIDLACAPDDFEQHVQSATHGEGVNVILDPVGGAYFERNLKVLASRGCLVIISTMGGANVELSLALLMRKRLRVLGTMLRNRSLEEKVAAVRAFAQDLMPLLESGQLKPIIDATYPLERADEAYEAMERNRNVGKIVLVL